MYIIKQNNSLKAGKCRLIHWQLGQKKFTCVSANPTDPNFLCLP